jgi:hypothetical protein
MNFRCEIREGFAHALVEGEDAGLVASAIECTRVDIFRNCVKWKIRLIRMQPAITAHLRNRDRGSSSPFRSPIHRCMKPSVSVCMKLTSWPSSSSESPNRPTNLVFMLLVDSGPGQHVVPSPGSFVAQRRRVSRVL